jgi:hypothetical protein
MHYRLKEHVAHPSTFHNPRPIVDNQFVGNPCYNQLLAVFPMLNLWMRDLTHKMLVSMGVILKRMMKMMMK